MAAKLALIDSDLLMRLLNKSNPLPPADPTLKEINRIDDKMQTVLTERETDKNLQFVPCDSSNILFISAHFSIAKILTLKAAWIF